MLVMECYHLTARNDVGQQFVESVGLNGFRIVAHVGAGETVPGGKLVIHSDGEIVFVGHLLPREGEDSRVAIPKQRPGRQRVERPKKSPDPLVHVTPPVSNSVTR